MALQTEDRQLVLEVAAGLEHARRLLFITGAGLSADSGLPTYRGVGGLYNDADTEEGVPIEQALSGPMFARDPALTWKYILQIENACRHSQPNAGHRAIAALERRFEVHVLTQNVDGLHRAAGSSRVIDLHGDVHLLYCTACDWRERVQDYRHLPQAMPPRCPDCAGVLRPDVVLFHEQLPLDKMEALEQELRQGFDAVFSVGTSSLFSYISRPVWVAAEAGALTVEINPGQTRLSRVVEHRIQAGAADTLALLLELLG